MDFTPQEMKLIERLRKEERQWPSCRWILLAAAAFGLAVAGYIGVQIIGVLGSEPPREDAAFMVAFFWPKCLLEFCVSAYLITWAIRDWHGDVRRMLLLRLLDAQQKKRVDDTHGA